MCRLAGSPCFRIAGPWPPEDWWERARGVPFSPVRSSKQVGLGWDIRGVAARLTEDAIGKEEGMGGKKHERHSSGKRLYRFHVQICSMLVGFLGTLKDGVDVDSACDRRPGRGRWPCHL